MASALAVGQGGLGAVMTAAPGRTGRWSAGRGAAPPDWIVRLLGGRMVVQASVLQAVERKRPGDLSAALRAGALVDLLHGTSMVAAAAIFPRYRRSALLSAGLAFAAAAGEKTAAGSAAAATGEKTADEKTAATAKPTAG